MDVRSFECYLCHKNFKSSVSFLNRHMKKHTIACFFECPMCQKTFTRRYSLKIHYKQKHGDGELQQTIKKVTTKRYSQPSVKTYQCPICKKIYRHRKANLQQHMEKVHEKTAIKSIKKTSKGKGRVRTRYACICRKMFSTQSALYDHTSSVHGGDRYTCTICLPRTSRHGAAFFTTKRALLSHCARAKHGVPDIVEPLHALMFQWNSDESN